jgi:hypothetical protein
MSQTQPTLSVCCLTHGPLDRTAVLLDQLAEVADEIVCAVDSSVPVEALSVLDGHADVVARCHVDRVIGSERNLAWLHSLCSGRWIFRIDSDEVLSDELLSVIPTLVDSDDVMQYLIRRLWLFPGPEQVLDEYPWSDDWQLRLIRNEPGLIYFEGSQHTSVELVSPFRWVNEPMLHLDLIVTTPESREAKIERYESARPGYLTDRGTPMNDFYRPEAVDAPHLTALPPVDIARVRQVIDAAGIGRVPGGNRRWHPGSDPHGIPLAERDEIDRSWAGRTVAPTAYQATFEMLEDVTDMKVGEHRSVLVRVQNTGTDTWPWGNRRPYIRLAHRWLNPGDGSVHSDGVRTLLTADMKPGVVAFLKMAIVAPDGPGRYVLAPDLVHEEVSWFEAGPRLEVTIHPAG